MRYFTRTMPLALLLIPVLMLAPGCIFDPKSSPDPPPKRDIEWPAMTKQDDVIKTLVLCYTYPKQAVSMTKYEGVLHSDYIFYLHEEDVKPGEDPIFTRAQDINSTRGIFENETILSLFIPETGSWHPREKIDDEDCENCWETTRTYAVRAQFGAETVILESPAERAFVTIVVAPNEKDSTKWVIRAMYDLGI